MRGTRRPAERSLPRSLGLTAQAEVAYATVEIGGDMTCALKPGDNPTGSSSLRLKEVLAVSLGLLVLATLGGCKEGRSPVTAPGKSEATTAQASGSTIDPLVADRFRDLVPADWRLREALEASATYDVQLASGSGGEPIVVRGVVLLDGRFERYLSPLDFSPSAIAKERKEFGPVPEEYPKIDGFEAVVDSDSLGFDTNRGIHRRSIKYFNRDQGVFCRGTSPGLLRCLWGDPQVRLVLNFHSDHTAPTLGYIKQNVFRE